LCGDPDQTGVKCRGPEAKRTQLPGVRDELNKPQLSSRVDAERETELTQVNGKLYTVAKAEFDKSCPAVANAPPLPPSAVVQ